MVVVVVVVVVDEARVEWVVAVEFWPMKSPLGGGVVVVEEIGSSAANEDGVVGWTESTANREAVVVVEVDGLKSTDAAGVLVENKLDSSTKGAAAAVVVVGNAFDMVEFTIMDTLLIGPS